MLIPATVRKTCRLYPIIFLLLACGESESDQSSSTLLASGNILAPDETSNRSSASAMGGSTSPGSNPSVDQVKGDSTDDPDGGIPEDTVDMMIEPPEPIRVPEFGRSTERHFLVKAKRSDGLSHPRDLQFDPGSPADLWVVDRDWDGNIILFDAGTDQQRIERMRDVAASHFMEEVSSVAFSDIGSFATCQESRNNLDGFAFPDNFMGPALWSTDLMIHCNVNQREGSILNGSHLDMLHQSPLCMGITHQQGNAFFVTDGANGHVVRYDFREPHVPGGDDHSDGEVTRYPELTFTRSPDIPSHLVLDGQNLYYADTGTGTIRVADMSTGNHAGDLLAENEPLAVFNQYTGVNVRVFAEGLDAPSGLLVANGRLFVSLPKTGEIVAFNLDGTELQRINTGHPGVMGLEMGPNGKLWFVNAYQGTVNVLEPGPIDVGEPPTPTPPSMGDCVYPEWSPEPGVGKVLPPYTWQNAQWNGRPIGNLSVLDMYCRADWSQVKTIIFVVVTEWIPWLFEYVGYIDALSPRINEAGGRIVFIGAQDDRGALLDGPATDVLVGQFTPKTSGIRVGEADNSFGSQLIDSGLIDHMPSTFVVRRSDMTVLATQRTRSIEHLPLVEITQDPDADWSNPGPATIRPVLASNCEEGVEESSEPNDTPDDAVTIGLGEYSGGVCGRRGDFYFVNVQGRWVFELIFSHAIADLDILFFGEDGQPLRQGNGQPLGVGSSDDNEIFEWRGPLLLYVYGYDGATSGYQINVRR